MPGRSSPDRGLRAATFVDHRRQDGLIVRWESRHHRKHLRAAAGRGSTWWAPRARGWWIAVLFAVGSAAFAVGSVPGYVSAVGVRCDSVTYFIGSLFFTSAAFLTYREAVDAAPGSGDDPGRRRFFVYQPRRIDWTTRAEVGCRPSRFGFVVAWGRPQSARPRRQSSTKSVGLQGPTRISARVTIRLAQFRG